MPRLPTSRILLPGIAVVCFLLTWSGVREFVAFAETRPNILWIVVEDASPHVGCYGERTIRTPHIDALAADGVRFTRAMVTSPVCSPSRSAMVTGMYPTTLGAHSHRSQRSSGKGGGNLAYYSSFRLPVVSVPELFRRAGYHVTNTRLRGVGKTDYNFAWSDLYADGDWRTRQPGQPFFAQLQLAGGKARKARAKYPVDAAEVRLPPYYPDDPVLREDWADYLATWQKVDHEVGEVVSRLRSEKVLEKTILFFWTDHGVSHLRGKQFLYDEGIHVPLIVRFGDGRRRGTTRTDLVEHIDVAAASLALAGIELPDFVQGRDVFSEGYEPRDYVFSARDRCDETVDILRAVRTKRFKYIRNFLSYLPHAQPNQYKDGKAILRRMRQLHTDGKLNTLQALPFQATRPAEELYDLESDPYETVNLAAAPEHRQKLAELRRVLYGWMVETRDVGLIPEPILEDLGRRHGSKYQVLRGESGGQLVGRLIALMDAGQRGDHAALKEALTADRPSLRYWAATWLGNRPGVAPALDPLVQSDPDPSVRVAAALALTQLGIESHCELLAREIENENLVAGMYAIRALETLGPRASSVLPAISRARKSPYEFTRRFARRLTTTLETPK